MRPATVTLALVATTAASVTVLATHHHRRPASASELASVVPISPRASRAHVREPMLRRVQTPRARRHLRLIVNNTHNWAAVAACESSGNWHDNTGNGYYGGLQEDMEFWRDYGGFRLAARPDLATRAEQVTVAERGLAVQGRRAWPVCGRYL